IEIDDVERALHAIGRGAQKDYGHCRRHGWDGQQREAAQVIGKSGNDVACAKVRRPTRARSIGFGDLRLRRAQQRDPQHPAPGDAKHVGGPRAPQSQAAPAIIGVSVVPMRAKKLNRPIYSASPSASWAIKVCKPDQANCSAAPLSTCTSSNAQNHGTSGKIGANAIAVHTKNRVTRRVPRRSIKTPTWIDRNTASSERPPTSMPTSPA